MTLGLNNPRRLICNWTNKPNTHSHTHTNERQGHWYLLYLITIGIVYFLESQTFFFAEFDLVRFWAKNMALDFYRLLQAINVEITEQKNYSSRPLLRHICFSSFLFFPLSFSLSLSLYIYIYIYMLYIYIIYIFIVLLHRSFFFLHRFKLMLF